MVIRLVTLLICLAAFPSAANACSRCFSTSPFHLGLVLGTLFLLPLPGLIAWGLYKAAKTAEKESNSH